MSKVDFDPHIPFVPDGPVVSKARRWARAWKEAAIRAWDAVDCYEEYEASDKARIQALEEGLRWLTHLHHGVGKSGNPPGSDEWKAAIDSGCALLSETPE